MSTATSLLTPATSSLTRISIGWLNPNLTPGTLLAEQLVHLGDQVVAGQSRAPLVPGA